MVPGLAGPTRCARPKGRVRFMVGNMPLDSSRDAHAHLGFADGLRLDETERGGNPLIPAADSTRRAIS